jgi:hypothetical protein
LSEENYSKDESKRKIFQYKSIVFAKQDKPKWNEVVNVGYYNSEYFFLFSSFIHLKR